MKNQKRITKLTNIHSSRLDKLERKIKRLVKRASKMEEEVDDFAQDFIDAAGEALNPGTSGGQSGRMRKVESDDFSQIGWGITALSIIPMTSGFMQVQLDHTTIELPAKLGALLRILAADTGASTDSFVEWKSRDAVRSALKDQTGMPVTNGALTNLVYRLRRELLKQAKLHPRFVQVHPTFGLRFALKRNPGAMTS